MPDFDTIEDTLFVPMLGRIYASEKFPEILYDKKALELKDKLPENIKGKDTQTQYTLLASAVRSTNMDRYIKDFLERNPDGVIVELGCGLETTFFRNDNGKTKWYEVDLEDVINYRKSLLEENERDICVTCDAFSQDWIKKVRSESGDAPILVTASGLFYYFSEEKVFGILKALKDYGQVEAVFDVVNSAGMSQMSKYMNQVGHSDASMYFYVDSALYMVEEVGAELVKEEPYYAHIKRKGMKFMTSMSMKFSDKWNMVKMEHIKFN